MFLRDRVYVDGVGYGFVAMLGIVYNDVPFAEGSNYYITDPTPVPCMDIQFDNGLYERYKGNQIYGVEYEQEEG
jgi:hypothetical protein